MFLHTKWSASISTVVIALTIATIAVSCSSTPNPRIEAGVSVDTLGAEQQIRNSLAAWLSAYDRQDYVAMAKVWAPDILGWYPELPPFTIDEVRRGLSRQRAQ